MRILCLSDTFPWPPTDGYRQRLSQLLAGLGDAGQVDLFAVESERDDVEAGPAQAPGVARAWVSARPRFQRDGRKVLRWMTSSLPRAVLWHEWDLAGEELAAFAHRPYDMVWYSHLDCYLALAGQVAGPAVVDLDNLEDLKLRALRQVRRAAGGRASLSGLVGQGFDLVDEWRWARRQREAASSATRVVVCSELDRERLGAPTAVVVPNGYQRQGPPVGGREPLPSGPVLTMVGLMTYPPNLDAARHFARQVLPLVRNQAPGAEFRVVGRGSDDDAELASLPGVVPRGQVPDIRHELARTDVAVVPIRFGGGTRIKVLEAFAHRVPVVATRTGAEGLDAAGGRHLVVVDDDDHEGMARGCLRLVQDAGFRRRLVDEAERLYDQRYRWDAIRPRVSSLARAVAEEAQALRPARP